MNADFQISINLNGTSKDGYKSTCDVVLQSPPYTDMNFSVSVGRNETYDTKVACLNALYEKIYNSYINEQKRSLNMAIKAEKDQLALLESMLCELETEEEEKDSWNFADAKFNSDINWDDFFKKTTKLV